MNYLASGFSVALATLSFLIPCQVRADVQVSGKTYTEKKDNPAGDVTVQAYTHERSSPVGKSAKSKKDTGEYVLSIEAGSKFAVVYFHPDSKYLEQLLPVRDAFDGTDGERYPKQDVTFFTPEQFQKNYGKQAYQKHLERLSDVLPKKHPRVERIKELLKRLD